MSLFISSLCEEWLFYGRGEEPKGRILLNRWMSVFSLCQKKANHPSQVHMKPAGWVSPGESIFIRRSVDSFQFSKGEINNSHEALPWAQPLEWWNEWMVSSHSASCLLFLGGCCQCRQATLWDMLCCVHRLSLNDNLWASQHSCPCVSCFRKLTLGKSGSEKQVRDNPFSTVHWKSFNTWTHTHTGGKTQVNVLQVDR